MTLCTSDLIRPLTDEATSTDIPKQKPFHVVSCMEFTAAHHADRVIFLLDAICSLGYKVHLCLKGSATHKKECLELKEKYKKQVSIMENESDIEAAMKKADVYFSSVGLKKKEKEVLIANGIVPVIPAGDSFINFDPQTESGNAFTFEEGNFWQMMEAFVRSRETRKFSYDWRNIRQSVRQTVV